MDILSLVLVAQLFLTLTALGVAAWQWLSRRRQVGAAQQALAQAQQEAQRLSLAHAALSQSHSATSAAHASLQQRFAGVLDAEAERHRVLSVLQAERAKLEADNQRSYVSWDAALRDIQSRYQQFVGIVDAHAERQLVLGAIEGERARAQAEFERAKAAWDQALRTLAGQHQQSGAELAALRGSIEKTAAALRLLDEEAHLHSFGFYKPRYDFATSDKYEARLEQIRERQKQMLKNKTAATCNTVWTVNGNAAEGRKQINQTIKLMLRAFNGECDASIARVKYNNIEVMEGRIRKSFDDIIGLVAVQQCTFSPEYLALKLEELYLNHRA